MQSDMVGSPQAIQSIKLAEQKDSAGLIESKQQITAKKIAKIGAAIILTPIAIPVILGISIVALSIAGVALPIAGAYLGIKAIKDKAEQLLGGQSLRLKSEAMKKKEEITKFESMKEIYLDKSKTREEKIDRRNEINRGFEETRQKLIKSETSIIQNKVHRHLAREFARQKIPLSPELIKEISSQCDRNLSIKSLKLLIKDALVKASQQDTWDKIEKNTNFTQLMDGIRQEIQGFQHPKKAALALKLELRNLIEHLHSADSNKSNFDAHRENVRFVHQLRRVLKTEAYQALKDDPSDPTVRLIHQFCIGIWNNVKVLDHYRDFGAELIEETRIGLRDDVTEIQQVTIALSETWDKAAEKLHTDHGADRITYALNNRPQAMGALASTGIVGTYDPHGVHYNNPSLQGETKSSLKIAQKQTDVVVHNCYGGSPTVGKELSHEFLAVLQAAENNQFAEEKNRLEEIPDVVTYTNFQQLAYGNGEGQRSEAIMRANQLFPLSFLGITLAKDTPFYAISAGKVDQSCTWPGAAAFGQEMLQELTRPASFKIESHKQSEGFYFPGGEDRWKPVFQKAIAHANALFKDKQAAPGQEAFELRAAYQEAVYSFIQGYQEMEAAKSVAERLGTSAEKVLVMAVRACKENIDRGGAENVKYMYTRLPENMPLKERMDLLVGAFHSRALSVRNRLILTDRVQHLKAFIKHLSPSKFKTAQDQLLKEIFDQDESFKHEYKPVFNKPSASG